MHTHSVQIYYEDTDFSGVVYHANYLRYFERAREHILGVKALVDLYRDTGIGFVVYKANLTYKAGAVHGDGLSIQTTVDLESAYRAVFMQRALRDEPAHATQTKGELLVEGELHLACVDGEQKLVPLPKHIVDGLRAFDG
ncbi:MAG: YbgC/FadM family acyl-CoA thioesterase [Deltaproteobacteria bacterium]|nr:YbgC/FadM family acyl-CoA thioesterase [Deltaproteobacteria bacterium]